MKHSRRRALQSLASMAAASPLLRGQDLAGEPQGRITPLDELVNVFEAEATARGKLAGSVYQAIAGGDRTAFDRMTFRPRMLVNVEELDLGTELFGQKLYTPILVGPVADQRQYHPEGELAAAEGASAAQALMVVSGRSSVPIEQIAARAKTPLWIQLHPEPDMDAVVVRAQRAIAAGCQAVCLTVDAPGASPSGWAAVDRLRKGAAVPLVVKGILSAADASEAVEHGVSGIVVSSHGAPAARGLATPIDMLPSIAGAVGGRAAVLVDGSFRRGSDILKGLALGAHAVLIARAVIWGLAAYGAAGVERVLRLLQAELARDMGMSGRVNIGSIDRDLVRIHQR